MELIHPMYRPGPGDPAMWIGPWILLTVSVIDTSPSQNVNAQVTGRAWTADSSANPITLGQLSTALDQTRSELRRLIGGDDLIEGLYFGWLEQPYSRADIARAVKTFTVLQYEERLRRLDNGALSDAQIRDMLHGLAGLADRTRLPARHHGFYPHRIRADCV